MKARMKTTNVYRGLISLSRISTGLTYFDKNVGVVGSEGPRWENVNSFAESADGRLWICAGEFIHSLLVWSKDDGYKILTIERRSQFRWQESVGT